MRHDNLVTVFSTHTQGQAEAIRNLLRAEGIPCVLGGILRARSRGVPVLDIQVKVPARIAATVRQRLETLDLTLTLSSLLPSPSAPNVGGPDKIPLDAPEPTTAATDPRLASLGCGLETSKSKEAASETGSDG
jgi:hypothetical protein